MSSELSKFSFSEIGVHAKRDIKLKKKQKRLENLKQKKSGNRSDNAEENHLSMPTSTRSTDEQWPNVTMIAQTSALKHHFCKTCNEGPLDLSKVKDRKQRDPQYLNVVCEKCGQDNTINLLESEAGPGRSTNKLARKVALGCLH